MKAVVNEKECVGCGLCEDTCPSVFKVEGAVAKVIVDPVPGDAVEACRQAVEDCPVTVITLQEK